MKLTRSDVILIAVLLTVAILCGVAMLFLRPQGGSLVATVEIDGVLTATLPLSEDAALTLPTGHTLEVKAGAVSVTAAPCRDLVCRHSPAASRAGDTIICLPERVIITVREEGST